MGRETPLPDCLPLQLQHDISGAFAIRVPFAPGNRFAAAATRAAVEKQLSAVDCVNHGLSSNASKNYTSVGRSLLRPNGPPLARSHDVCRQPRLTDVFTV